MIIDQLILVFSVLAVFLFWMLKYFARNMRMGQQQQQSRQSSGGSTWPVAFVLIVGVLMYVKFDEIEGYMARSDTENTVTEEKEWKKQDIPEEKQEVPEIKKEAPPSMDDFDENTQRVGYQKQPIHYQGVVGQGLLEKELDRVNRYRKEKKVERKIAAKTANYRIQLLAGPNEEGANKVAQEQRARLGMSIYVLVDQNAGSQAYKVMAGDFSSREAAKQFIHQNNIPGIAKDMSASSYEIIAHY